MSALVRIICIPIALSSVAVVAAQEKPAEPTAFDEAADSRIDLSEQLETVRGKHDIPGMVCAIVRGDRVVATGAAGARRVGDDTPVEITDRFHIGSCTKAMTATLVAMLVEQGKLKWSTTIADVFPERRDAMHADYRQVTLTQLLSHRAGAPTNLDADGLWGRLWAHTGTPTEQRLTLLDGVIGRPPVHKPGTKYLYSNAGVSIAGAMAERVTGESWETLMREMLFEPLGMKSAGFGAPGDADTLDEPRGHVIRDGKVVAIEPGKNADNPAGIGPGGIVHCSITDWGRFVALHLRGSRGKDPLLRQATFRRLHRPIKGQDYALGWIATERPWGGKVLTHAGSNTMWYAVVWMAPQKDFGVLVICNLGGDEAAKACDEAAWGLIQYYLKQT